METATAGTEVEGELGPAMSVLSERQRAFVRAYIALGRNGFADNSLAAREAGYSAASEVGLRVAGHRLTHDAKVQAAIMEETHKRVCLAAAVVATPVLISIALNEELGPNPRIKAALALMDRGGMPAQTEHKVTVQHSVNTEKMEMLAERLARELGVDPARLIGVNRTAGRLIEAQAVEVPAGE